MPSHQFAFIAGLHRSGTSILFKCLKDHPEISGFHDTGVSEDEGQHLQSVYLPAKEYGGPGKFGHAPAMRLTEASPLVSEESRARLLAEWGRYWDLSRPVLLEKSPPNLLKTRFLQALFPGAAFVAILRHPVAVSYATQRWCDAGVRPLIEHWLACHEAFAEDAPRLGRLAVLKYEEFVARPGEHLRALHAFLGVSARPCTRPVLPDTNDKYFGRWREKLREMSDHAAGRAALAALEGRVRRFGYSLEDLTFSGPSDLPGDLAVRPRLAAAACQGGGPAA
jgi:hypothetical protein